MLAILACLAPVGALGGPTDANLPCLPLPEAPLYDTAAETAVAAIEAGPVIRTDAGLALRLEGLRFGFGANPMPETEAAMARLLTALPQPSPLPLLYRVGPAPVDRWDGLVVQMVRSNADGHRCWLQAELVAAGVALVDPPPGGTPFDAALLALEAQARATGRGLWQQPGGRVLRAEEPERLLNAVGRFVLVEGVVSGGARLSGRDVANFGEDWRSDFTIAVAGDDRLVLALSALAPRHARLRVRGLLRLRAGPYMEIAAPTQIERVN